MAILTRDAFIGFQMMVEFPQIAACEEMPELIGSPAEITEGENLRQQYMERFDTMLREMVKQGEIRLRSTIDTEPNIVKSLNYVVQMNAKVLASHRSADWWRNCGADFLSDAPGSFKKFAYYLKFYSA